MQNCHNLLNAKKKFFFVSYHIGEKISGVNDLSNQRDAFFIIAILRGLEFKHGCLTPISYQ